MSATPNVTRVAVLCRYHALDAQHSRGSNISMAELLGYAGDFRAEAEAVSVDTLRRKGIADASDLTRAGVSLCVHTPVDAVKERRLLKIILTTQFGLSLALVFGGGAIAFSAIRMQHNFRSPPAGLGVLIAIAGFWASVGAIDIQNWLIRRRLAMLNAPRPDFQPAAEPVVVQIEDPQTCHELKVVVEDHAILYCDGVRKLIVMEGIFYRYVIWGRDVTECRLYQPKRTRHFILTFQLADPRKSLSLALSHNSAEIERERQRSKNLSRPPLAGMLQETLGIVVTLTTV